MKNKQKNKNKIIGMITIYMLLLITITSATTNHYPENATYAPEQEYSFKYSLINIDDVDQIKLVIFKHNFLGSQINETALVYDNETNTFWFNIDDLSAGMYEYEWELKNETDIIDLEVNTYEIQKAEPNMTLLVNSETNNITIEEETEITIKGTLEQEEGTLILLINNEEKAQGKTIEKNTTLEIGNNTITLKYEETQNYTEKEQTLIVEVLKNEPEIKIIIETDKEEYSLGETAYYLVKTTNNTEVEIEICRNVTQGNLQWEECTTKQTIQTPSQLISHTQTKAPGIHEIRGTIKNSDIQTTKKYTVKDSMKLTTEGKTKLKLNEETTLKATITGGITPYTYTWTLPDETTRTGQELKIKYATEGNRNIKITAKDKEGNTKEETITLDVRPYYDLTIEVKNEQNQVVKDAIITITDLNENAITDTTGKVKFNLPKDEYNIKIDAEGYYIKTENIKLDSTTNIVIQILKRPTSTSNNINTEKITLEKPENEATITSTQTEFQAKINMEQTSTCKLFITDKNSQWFIELARKENVKTGTITFEETIETGEYKWKISCENAQGIQESEIREFSKTTTQTTSTTMSDTIDAGELRRQIEQAHENLDNLGLEGRKAADALDLQEMLRITLRDYERILRDLNSLALRRDLTDQQKQEKIQEYKEAVIELEKTSPLLLEVKSSEEYISKASKDELEQIVKEYAEQRNIQGKPDIKEIENEQNKIRTRTFVAQTTITYLNGETKDITLMHKTIEYTGEINRHHFLLEKIPEQINTDLITKQTHDVLIRNKLIRFEKPETITYYLEGHQDLETTKKIHTILLTESTFKTSGTRSNTITGLVTLNEMNLDSTSILIIILIILIIAYIIYAFDLKERITSQIQGLGKDKKIKELSTLIHDAKDYLETKNLERANLIYKEIKMMYEKAQRKVKNEVYEDAIILTNLLNETYMEHLIQKIQQTLEEKNKKEATKLYNKLTDAYNNAEPNTKKMFKEQLPKLRQKITEQ